MLSSLAPVNHTQRRLMEKYAPDTTVSYSDKSMDEYLDEVKARFEAPLAPKNLFTLSTSLQHEFHDKLQSSDISMLPSYHHTLPTGSEKGTYLALDVGGSNFRLSLIELTGHTTETDGMRERKTRCFAIDTRVRALRGEAFFEWMAERIEEVLDLDKHKADRGSSPLAMGLAWSFPIEQTSRRSGVLLAMGKQFSATHGVEGKDLCDLIMTPCIRRGLNVQLQTIVNDSSATLLSQAYRDPSTRISLILGTGTNSAIFLPVSALAPSKFGMRPDAWHAEAKHVLVNTELSMFGKDAFPTSPWDEQLNQAHDLPDFQPLELKVGGLYLGEIVRRILLEAILDWRLRLFDGEIPESLSKPYALETGTIAAFESDSTASLSHASKVFKTAHSMSRDLSIYELQTIQQITRAVSSRAAAYLATAVHALWCLLAKSEDIDPSRSEHVTIACNGSVMEKYPGLRSQCQRYIDDLTILSGATAGSVTLEMAPESSIFGAAVAVSCLHD